MTAPKLPCWNCRKHHVKCDKERPRCGRCETRNLDCVPVERKAVFRRGSKNVRQDCFASDQTWVNSEPREWRRTETILADKEDASSLGPDQHYEVSGLDVVLEAQHGRENDVATGGSQYAEYPGQPSSLPVTPPDTIFPAAVGIQQESPASGSSLANTSHESLYNSDLQPLANIEESCLLRYFIEELSPWFDHCDDRSHFRLVVPLRAQHCLTLRNAIFAVSSRHLSRLPQYKTPQGIIYHGQFLPNLDTSSAVEYMLKCIPGLLSFQIDQEPQRQDDLMAAAIILRQYEEMEEEEELEERIEQRVNFLAITQTIIYSMISSPLRRSSLATAAYWIAIRQEVYYALTRKRVPCFTFTPEDWSNATATNKMIMHTGEVTKWCWGDRSPHEYERLKLHQHHLTSAYSTHFLPILQTPPDISKTEIFPTVWYTTESQVTGVQHLELARMILTAENPRLRNPTPPRALHRKAEAQVRCIILNLCGIAVNNLSRRTPALVNAVISIMLYGEYFTEQRERDALMNIIERTRDMRAWPLWRPYERLRGLWEEGDSVEV
ncbi:hypothetical protein BDW59DRAFT_152342, partial [Aspergillus cavernicola]